MMGFVRGLNIICPISYFLFVNGYIFKYHNNDWWFLAATVTVSMVAFCHIVTAIKNLAENL